MNTRKLKKHLPASVISFLKKIQSIKLLKQLKVSYNYDLKRYSKHSDTLKTDSSSKLIGKIIRRYHVIEKGLTMPDTRLGFGKDRLIKLIENCIDYVEKYGTEDIQIKHAISVILEYEFFHRAMNFQLDDNLIYEINRVKNLEVTSNISEQRKESKDSYFKYTNSSFKEFALSRSSIRNFTEEEVSLDVIKNALELAQSAPSACNRQCWRTYVFTNKNKMNEILKVQGGNRGFGHLANKLIVIASDMSMFTNGDERNQVYVDGGIYAMNLLYALHYNNLAACILNCSNSVEKDLKLRQMCQIKDSEVFVAMIICGHPPENFKIAVSERYALEVTNTIN
ncbi:nitroreductase family protein [Algibacter pacificus]|uniref:nitroreductase family protein n=1 Tax=Algibacter pacificus TaxID=2599389 RepID=UPI0011C6F089|nr:nitroreductase family protein [Algibacter pacificus]